MSAPNLHDMLARDKLAHELNQEAKKQLRAHLNSCESLTDEEKEERYIMNAKHAHAMECEAIQKRELPWYDVHDIFSPELIREAEEIHLKRREELYQKRQQSEDEKERDFLQYVLDTETEPRPCMNLPTKTPSNQRWETEAAARAAATEGTVFQWLTTDIYFKPLQEKTFHLVRINGTHRWMYLTVTRLKTESLKDILENHLQSIHAHPHWEFVDTPDYPAGWLTWSASKGSFHV